MRLEELLAVEDFISDERFTCVDPEIFDTLFDLCLDMLWNWRAQRPLDIQREIDRDVDARINA